MEIIIQPHEEGPVLHPVVKSQVPHPEEPIAGVQGEPTTHQVVGTLLKGNSKKGVRRRGVVAAQFNRPGLVSVVCTSCILEGDARSGDGSDGHHGAEEVLERVLVRVFLNRVGSTEDVLPHGELWSDVAHSGDRAEDHLFSEFGPEVRHAEDLLEENVVLCARVGPLVVGVEQLHVGLEVPRRLNERHGVHVAVGAAFPVLVERVVGLGCPRRLPLGLVDVGHVEAPRLIEFEVHFIK